MEKFVTPVPEGKPVKSNAPERAEAEPRSAKYGYFDQLPVPVAVFLGEAHVFDFVNPIYCELISRTPASVLGKPLFKLYPELKGTLIEQILDQVFQTGQPRQINENEILFERDGALYRGYFNIKYQPLKNSDGQTEGIMAVGYEVTDQVVAGKKLSDSQQQLIQLADAMPQVVWIADADGVISYYNKRINELAGAVQGPDGKWKWEGVVHPDERADTVEAWQKSVATGADYEMEHRIAMRDGTYKWHLSRSFPQRDAEGTITRWFGTATDIDEQKKAIQKKEQSEQALAYQKKLLETITENTSLSLFMMDDRQHCIYMNEAAEKMTGFTVAEVVERPLHYFVHHSYPDGTPYPLEECPIDRAMPNKKRERGEDVFFHKDGHSYPVAFTASPIMLEGRAVGTVIEVRDITEEKKREQALLESENKFRTLTETLPQLVWMTDESGNYQYASRRWTEYTGLDSTRMDSFAEMVHPDDLPVLLNAWDHSLTTGGAYKGQARLLSREGEYRWHFVHGEPLRDDAGKISRWIGAFTDIHDQKAFTEQLEWLVADRTQELHESNLSLEEKNAQLLHANKELESFNYVASHDLQEPLRKIQTFINLLQNNWHSEQRSNYLAKINTSAQRMSVLLQAILNYSRLSRDEEHSFQNTDLNRVLRQVLDDFELLISEKEATITCSDLPAIEAIPVQMSQLFGNLIGNALKFCDTTPVLTITGTLLMEPDPELPLLSGQPCVRLSFADNGIGFEEKYAEKMFMLFQRLHRRESYTGTGIGLTICKRIVELHGGFIQAQSTAGQGSVFTVYLPVARPDRQPA